MMIRDFRGESFRAFAKRSRPGHRSRSLQSLCAHSFAVFALNFFPWIAATPRCEIVRMRQ